MKPSIFIVDGAIDMTGGLMAARREAKLLRDRARVIVVLPEISNVPDKALPEFEFVIRIPIAGLRKSFPSAVSYLPSLLRSGWQLRRALNKAGCQRLQINDFYLLDGMVARMLGFRGQIVTWVRMDPRTLGAFGRLCLTLARMVSSELVAVSNFIRSRLPAGYAKRVLYEPAIPAISAVSSAPATSRFVFIGNFIEGKGQDVAIEAFGRVALDHPAAELHFYGGDMGLEKNRAYLERLKKQAAAGPAFKQIHLHGYTDDPGRALDGALAALNLSQSESFSLTCQEASAAEIAVIATDCGGPREIIDDGVTGYLVRVGDVEAVADRMRRLLADPERARAMGEAGAILVRERFRADRFVEALVDIFELPRHARSDPKS